jgi:cytochrome c556
MADTSLIDRGYTYEDLKMALTHIRKLEAKIRDLESRLDAAGNLRPSLEVLQRMANGLDPFDRGRFQCAVAALPHETPKLTATVAMVGQMRNYGRLEDDAPTRWRRRQETIEAMEARNMHLVEGTDPAA